MKDTAIDCGTMVLASSINIADVDALAGIILTIILCLVTIGRLIFSIYNKVKDGKLTKEEKDEIIFETGETVEDIKNIIDQRSDEENGGKSEQ